MLSSEEREMLWAEVKKIKDAANESIDEYNKTAGDAPKEKRITVELLRNLVTQHVEGRS
jgi:hypothetical protein